MTTDASELSQQTARRVLTNLIRDVLDRSNSRYLALTETEIDALETVIYGGVNISGNGSFAQILRAQMADRERERTRNHAERKFSRRVLREGVPGHAGQRTGTRA